MFFLYTLHEMSFCSTMYVVPGRKTRCMRLRRKTSERRTAIVTGARFAPTIGEVLVRKSGEVAPLAWQDVVNMDDPVQKKIQVAACSKAIWREITRDVTIPALEPATLHATLANDFRLGTPGDGGIEGWKWTGVMGLIYYDLWISLRGRFASDTKSAIPDPETQRAIYFRTDTARYLRNTRNACLITRGGTTKSADTDSGYTSRPSIWFVAQAWNDGEPIVPVTVKPLIDPQVLAERARKEAKVTAQEAGENRLPLPVSTKFACRRAGCKPERFATETLRDQHEKGHDKTADYPFVCRGCGIGYQSAGGRKGHEKSQHPELYLELYPIACPYDPQCDVRFERDTAASGLGHHLGATWHKLASKRTRDGLIRYALTGAYPEDYTGPRTVSLPSASSTVAKAPAVVAATVSEPPAPTQASSTPSVAATTDTAAEDIAIGYLTSLIGSEQEARRELAVAKDRIIALEEENGKLREGADAFKEMGQLMKKMGMV